jgi:glucuronate isomerase
MVTYATSELRYEIISFLRMLSTVINVDGRNYNINILKQIGNDIGADSPLGMEGAWDRAIPLLRE